MSNAWEIAKAPPDSVIQSNVRTESNVGALLISGGAEMYFLDLPGKNGLKRLCRCRSFCYHHPLNSIFQILGLLVVNLEF
jgi:hypothetical protein